MARKRHSDEDVLKLLREIELKLTAGDDVAYSETKMCFLFSGAVEIVAGFSSVPIQIPTRSATARRSRPV